MLVGSCAVYIWAVQTDQYGPLNPAPPNTAVPLAINYPPYTANPPTGICAIISMDLEANGTLAQGVPVKVVNASGVVFSSNCGNIASVYVTIDGVAPVGHGLRGFVYGVSGSEIESFINLNIPNGIGNLSAVKNFQRFQFPIAGSYSPTVVVVTTNGTYPNLNTKTNVYTFTDFKIPVASTLDIQNAKDARIEVALSVVIVIFVFLEGLNIVLEHTKEE